MHFANTSQALMAQQVKSTRLPGNIYVTLMCFHKIVVEPPERCQE